MAVPTPYFTNVAMLEQLSSSIRFLVYLGAACATSAVAVPVAHAAPWSHWTEVRGSGHMVHSAVPPVGDGVTGLVLRTGAKVQIRQGDRNAVEIDADDNVLPLIDVHRDGTSLVIEDRSHFASDQAKVTVTVRNLSALSASGSSTVFAEGLVAPTLSIHLSGSSDLRVQGIKAERIALQTGGSSEVRLQGICNDLALQLGGSSEVDAVRLEARNVTLQAGGSSEVKVWAKLALTGAVGGSSEVRYYGVRSATIASGGSSSIERLGDAP